MDVEDFTHGVQPHHRRSRLEKFKVEIWALKREGYSDMQVRDWLSRNGITVSRENVRKFIKRHLKSLDTAPSLEQAGEAVTLLDTDKSTETTRGAVTGVNSGCSSESNTQRIQRQAREQREKAAQYQFKHDKTGNNH